MNNTGQTKILNKVRNELESLNIVLSSENDWNTKLGVNLTQNEWEEVEWQDIFEKMFVAAFSSKPGIKNAHILVTEDALSKLVWSGSSFYRLFPNAYRYITEQDDEIIHPHTLLSISTNQVSVYNGEIFGLTIKVLLRFLFDDSTENHIDKYYFDYTMIHSVVNFYGTIRHTNTGWKSPYPIEIARPDYSLSSYRRFPVIQVPFVDINNLNGKYSDKVEIELTINNLPLLNPVTQGRTIITRGIVWWDGVQGEEKSCKCNFYANILRSDGDTQWRIVYNGYLMGYFDGYDNTFNIDIDSPLWIQIYKKDPNDLEYTMTHREWTIGNENCYISAIRLLP